GALLEIESHCRAVAVVSRRAELPPKSNVQCQARSYLPVVLEIGRVFLAANVIPGPPEHCAVVQNSQFEICEAEARLRTSQWIRRGGRWIEQRSGQRARTVGAGIRIRRLVDDFMLHMKAELQLVLAFD